MDKNHVTIFDGYFRRMIMRNFSTFFFWINCWERIKLVEIPKKCVIAAVPHKTWLDLPYTIMIAFELDLHIRMLAKEKLFRSYSRWLLLYLGCIPIKKGVRAGNIDIQAKILEQSGTPLQLVISPEGTRKDVKEWEPGFYWIAFKAKVPIVLFYIDYKRRRVIVGKTIIPTGDIDADVAVMKDFYKQCAEGTFTLPIRNR